MYVSVRKYQAAPASAEEAGRRVEEGFVPIISQVPGFVAYYFLNTGYDVVLSVSVFRDQAGADESNSRAAIWVKQNLASLLPNPPEITAGYAMTSKVS
ncbi:MAG TPA: antibiotic biosynthesis monooxygenase [Ktedonobacteraceae bacterium]|nr:antibiotic biosynthesis monooxygenase [Ktedonobacteraceae bacterium]